MHRRKILWLASWYPNRNDRFDGDFIQRHARAAAIGHDIHVIYVTEAAAGSGEGEEIHRATGLTEQIIYTDRTRGLFARVRKALRWKSRCQQAVADYVRTHGVPDAVHVHVPWKAGLIALWMKQKWNLPYIVSEHWGFYGELESGSAKDQPSWMMRLLGQVYAGAARVVTVSGYLSGLLKRTVGRGADVVIPNVVDTTLFFPGAKKYERFTFIHVSNMMEVKNVGLLLEAFARVIRNDAPAQLILVGNRDANYVDQARALGLLNDSVFFRGEVPYADVADEVRRAHALVVPSRSETFSCVTAEALCCGLPVVASAAGALPELVDDSNGLLVKPGDAEELVIAMRTMIKEYARFDSASIGAAAAGKWSYAAVSQAFDDLYAGL